MKGIYRIKDNTGRCYVGSSKNINKRRIQHFKSLSKGIHHNTYLQRSYNKHGLDFFSFEILEETELLFEREIWFIENTNSEYNIGSVGGGDNITKHPNYLSIKEKLLFGLEKARQSKKPETYGDKNPNWKGGISGYNICICGKKKLVKSRLCKDCGDSSRVGEKNPFFGKSHSVETINKIKSKLSNNIVMPEHTKLVVIYGIEYRSITFASEQTGIERSLLQHRLKSSLYREYYFVGDKPTETDMWIDEGKNKAIIVDDVFYPSSTNYSKIIGVGNTTISNRLKSENYPNYVYCNTMKKVDVERCINA